MDVTVVGSVALDSVETPVERRNDVLGGAATFFSLAASNYVPVHLVGIVGEDFPQEHVALLRSRSIDLDGLEQVPGKTFRWTGRYHDDMNNRDTLDTQLNVFEHFHPKLPERARQAKYLFLGNIHPALQLEVLEQSKAHFVGLDTMNLWIGMCREQLCEVLGRVDAVIVNDSEVRELTGHRNLVQGAKALHALGPRVVVIKKGEHGCALFMGGRMFFAPAYPLVEVVDPTGAGDTFAGGFMGFLASRDATDFTTLRQAVVHGSIVASFTCEDFGPDRLASVGRPEIEDRYKAFQQLSQF